MRKEYKPSRDCSKYFIRHF